MSRIRLTWANASTTIVEQRVYRSTSPLDINNMPEPLAILPRRDRGYLDNTIEDGLAYYYAVSSVLPDYSELISEQIRVEATPVSDPHWDKVVALLHFDGDLTDETGRTWQKIGDSSFVSGVFGSGLLLTRPNSNSNGLYSNGVVLDSDFTVECFISSNHTADEQCIVSCYRGSGSTGYTWEVFLEKTTGILYFYHHSGSRGSYVLVSGNKVADGVVHHIAVTREGGMLRLFVDGILHDSHVDLVEYTAEAPLCIGYQHGGGGRYPYKGMIDEFRLTKGVARYTENFTPPTEPFPNN